MAESLPIVLVPGLGSSVRTHLDILPALWRHGPIFVADHTRDDTIEALARRVLAEAPAPNFALIGHSLGGYIVLEMMRQAPQRIARLMLMNTQARTDPPEVTERRKATIAMIHQGRYDEAMEANFPMLVHPSRVNDEALRERTRLTRQDTGPAVYLRHQAAIMTRIDQRPYLKDIRVPTLVLSGDQDLLISNEFSREMADAIPAAGDRPALRAHGANGAAGGGDRGDGPLAGAIEPQTAAVPRLYGGPKPHKSCATDLIRPESPERSFFMLRDDINNAVKDAMRAKDERKLSTLRMVNSTIKNADIAARGEGKPPLSDADLLGVFQKMIKQRQESVELYDKGGRAELANQEREEIAIISAYLPKQMSDADVTAAIKGAIAETGAAGMKDMGKVIAALKAKYAGQMDFAKASGLVKAALTA
jgi:uncharacterized protein YqeY/pimeloyl-ACP methyl ester carboxylesterase